MAREGVVEAWEDAARHVDEKWDRAFAKAERVREGFRRLLGTRPARSRSTRTPTGSCSGSSLLWTYGDDPA